MFLLTYGARMCSFLNAVFADDWDLLSCPFKALMSFRNCLISVCLSIITFESFQKLCSFSCFFQFKNKINQVSFFCVFSEAHLEPSRKSTMEIFAKTVNGWKFLNMPLVLTMLWELLFSFLYSGAWPIITWYDLFI